jgi:WD40 repeat protein
MESGECLRILKGHQKGVNTVALSSDERKIVSGSSDKTVRTWDIKSCQCLRVLEGHGSSVTSVAISSDGKKIISGSDDKTIRIWDMEIGECLKIFYLRGLTCVGVDQMISKLVAGFSNGRVEFYEFQNTNL